MRQFDMRLIFYSILYGISLGNVASWFTTGKIIYGICAFVFFLFGTLHEIIYELKKFNDKNK